MVSCENKQTNDHAGKMHQHEFPKEIVSSDSLIILQITPNTYIHTTYMEVEEYGKVSCNGMIVVRDSEAVIIDIPADNKSSTLLIDEIYKHLAKKITAVVLTHFHDDSSGGLQTFHDSSITSYASNHTIELLRKKNALLPQNGFDGYHELKVGDDTVIVKYFGEGHTADNIIGYYPKDNVLFGGCLVKELEAGKGNLEDANCKAWPITIQKIIDEYKDVMFVIPGHGKVGDKNLLLYTMTLFSDTTKNK